jgi:hypothetical protein
MVKEPRGRPPRDPYQALRVSHLYACLRRSFESDYRFALELQKAFVAMNRPKSVETCKVVIRNLRRRNHARLSAEYVEALARTVVHDLPAGIGALNDDYPILRFMRSKLKVISEGNELHYMGWRYYQRLFTFADREHPWITTFLYTDDTDVAIDVAEVLGLRPEAVTLLEQKVLQPLKARGAVNEWEVLTALAEVEESSKNQPGKWYAATCIIVAYLGFLESLIYPIWGRDGEPGSRDRSVPPAGRQRVKKVEVSLEKLLATLKFHGVGVKMTSGQVPFLRELLLRLLTP